MRNSRKTLIAQLILAALVAMLCLPMSLGYKFAGGIYIVIFPAILITVFSSLLFLWISKTQSIAISFLVGAASGFIGILIWPIGWMLYTVITSDMFHLVDPHGLILFLVIPPILGGLIGVCLCFAIFCRWLPEMDAPGRE